MSDLVIPPGYGRVVGRVLRAVTVETGPAPLVGACVTVRPSVARVTRDGDPAPLIVGDAIECTLDDNGFLLGPDGEQGVLLVATDADTRPAGWHWLVRVSAPSVASYQWQVLVPEGVTTDMVSASSDPSTSGLPILEWRAILAEVWEAHSEVMDTARLVDHDRQLATAARAGAEQAADRAETARDQAVAARGAAEAAADTAETARNQAVTARDDAVTASDQAVTAKEQAEGFAAASGTYATQAETSAQDAASSAQGAATYVSQAAASAQDAEGSAQTAVSSAQAAATSEANALEHKNAAAGSAQAAEGFAGDAETARDAALIAAAGVAQHGRIQYDAATGRYTNDSLEGFFASRATPDSYGVSIPKGLSTACMKTGANAGVANPVLSTATQRGNDPYTAHTPFFTLEVNGGVEEDGTPYVTAVQGDARFKRDGSNGDVWIMTPVLYWQMEEEDEAVELQVSDSPLAGFTVQPKGLLPSGDRRPFMLYAKYALSIVDGVARSISGQPVAVRNVSPNSLITQCKSGTTGYSGKSFADDWYMKVMFLLKYATKDSQSVYAGVTNMYSHPFVTMAEPDTNRVIVATSAAAVIPVGATITLGTNVPDATDRAPAATFNIFDMRRVVDKVVVDSSNTALVVEGPRFTVQMGYRVYTMPWATGGCDRVVGDGSPTSPTNGLEPFVLQGIEIGLGMYESLGDVILSNLGSGQEVCLLPDSRLAATSVTANYRRTGKYLPNQAAAGWTYPTYPTSAEGLLFGADVGASTSTGMCDGQYLDAVTTRGTRQWLSLGSLGRGSLAGVWVVYANYALSGAGWSVGSRLSAIGRGGETP